MHTLLLLTVNTNRLAQYSRHSIARSPLRSACKKLGRVHSRKYSRPMMPVEHSAGSCVGQRYCVTSWVSDRP